jgi:hypothetical protein
MDMVAKISFPKHHVFGRVHNKSLLLECSISQKMVIDNNVQLKAKLDFMQLNDLLQNWIFV